MYPPTLLVLFGLSALANATPVYLTSAAIPTIERDLVGVLVGGNILPDGGATPPSSIDSLHTHTVSSIETSRLRTYSVEPGVVTPIQFLSPTAASLITKSTTDTAFLVQTPSPVFLPENPSNPPPSSNPMPTGWISDVSATHPAEMTEWKVIGIGVITVTLIAILVLSISFFDSWWGFLRSVCCGKKTDGSEGEETMVPDGERLRKSWEFKLANEDGRYPTLSSMEFIRRSTFSDGCK